MSIKSIDLKFTSANSVPVERAVVTREEWDAVKKVAEDMAFWLRQAASDEVTPGTEAGIYDALANYREAQQ